jgi:S-DNA-T family DNA segregation ATPase FtsK/SpoIIIE
LARGKTTEQGGSKAWSEVLGLILLGAGTLLFLALVSYSPADVPSWLFFSKQGAPEAVTENFIGPVGAIVAGFIYFLFGAAAYLLAVVLIGFGGAKFLSAELDLKKRLAWMAAFVVSGACLAGIQPWFLQSWKEHFNILGPGGWIGLALGKTVMAGLLGFMGATILLVLFYHASLIFMTGMHPVKFCKAVMVAVPAWLRERREAKLERTRMEQEAAVEEALANTPRSKRASGGGARPRKKTAAALEEEDEEDEEDEEEEVVPEVPLPEPKIIDTGAVTPAAKKPPAPPPKKKKETGPLGAVPDVHIENYQMPPLDLLDSPDAGGRQSADPNELLAVQSSILDTLKQFGLEASAGDITRGPTVTRFEVYPARGVRVDRIVSLEKDIARATRAEKINILAPIPGKDTVGIEIANSKKIKVVFRELLESDEWVNSKAKIPLALGKDVYGRTIIADLAQMPHLLIAGTTGSGKSVCVNAIIASMLYKFSPEELRFIMIDPKVVEMQHYGKLPHLAANVVTEPKKVLLALRYVIDEMERRYRIFAKCGLRNIHGFNTRSAEKKAADSPPPEPEEIAGEEEGIDDAVLAAVKPKKGEQLVIPDRLPYIVVIIDELADLMQTAPADVESAIARITQMARAAGIHMIVATQTPRADVVTGVIKANIPSRIAFQVASKLDSRVILDANGAEKLLGQGDMLYLPPGTSTLIRAQGVLVTDEEIHRVVDYVGAQAEPTFDPGFHEAMTSTAGGDDDVTEEDEELVTKCLEIIKQEGKASTSMLQRRLRLGYTRAARVVDILEQRGIVGPKDGAKDREILVDLESLPD